jgi:hypothetical protein
MASVGRRLCRSERGAELVEFAIAMPVMLLAMAGIIDFGLLFQSYGNDERGSGRRPAVLPDTGERLRDSRAIVDYMTTGGAKGLSTDVTVVRSVCGARQRGSGHGELHAFPDCQAGRRAINGTSAPR